MSPKNFFGRLFSNPFIRLAVFVPIAVAILLLFAYFALKPSEEDNFWVRVLVADGRKELVLRTRGRCDIYDDVTGKAIGRNAALHAGTVAAPSVSGIVIGDRNFNAGKVRISPVRGGTIFVGGTEYRGEMYISRDGTRLRAVNKVRLEDYLKGVLPKEVSRFWPFEALKAQAIASRSFAVHEALRRKSKEHDLFADTFSQVYGGKSAERWRTNWAVEDTRGKVLIYDGKVFPSYFHACCGGHTEDALKVWGKKIEPLMGVKCPWCRWCPHFRWRSSISADEMSAKLKSPGRRIGAVDDMKAGKRDASGRLESVDIKSGDHWVKMRVEDLRAIVGPGELKSSNFRIRRYPDHFLFAGFGWGHGVGMCQWGAFTLSLGWWRAEKILKYYYPGTRVGKLGDVLGKSQ